MKYVVDHIIDNIVVLENINNKEILEINKSDISFSIREGNILVKDGNNYYLDKELENKRREQLQEKLNKVKGES